MIMYAVKRSQVNHEKAWRAEYCLQRDSISAVGVAREIRRSGGAESVIGT
jgi:hypothetical protein